MYIAKQTLVAIILVSIIYIKCIKMDITIDIHLYSKRNDLQLNFNARKFV